MVSAAVSGASPKPFSRSAETGSGVASTMVAGMGQGLVAADRAFAVAPAERESQAGAGGGERLEAEPGQDARACRRPRGWG